MQNVTLEGPLSIRMAALLDGSPYEGVADLTVPHPMLMSMTYFNAQREVFQAGNLVLSYGTLSVLDREDDDPCVQIKAHSVVKYVSSPSPDRYYLS
jgi:hypothetical protein